MSRQLRVSHGLGLLTLMFLAMGIRVWRLDAQSLWLDEGATWDMISHPWSTLITDLFNPVSAYPLYHLLLKTWVTVAGESEWAVRFPSALAGSLAVVVLVMAAAELERVDARPADDTASTHILPSWRFPLSAALLLLISPFALWYAQEAKVYSLLLLVSLLLLWTLLRAVRLRCRGAWILVVLVAIVALFVHRLAVLLVLATLLALLIVMPPATPRHRLLLFFLFVGGAWMVIATMVAGLGSNLAESGAYIPAEPPVALWLTFVRFALDRQPGETTWWMLLPWVLLMVWGSVVLWRRAIHEQRTGSRILATMLFVPLLLFLLQLSFTRLYEARYLMLIYPCWLLLLALPAIGTKLWIIGTHTRRGAMLHLLLSATAIATSIVMLFEPTHGLFSGTPVKEQYREAFQELAHRIHPDDRIVLHPGYLQPLYWYYLPRFSTDPPPQPITFDDFKRGQEAFGPREWESARRQTFAGYARSLLVIAPIHARTVDPPPLPQDEYGLVGLYYQYSREQKKWPCGIWRSNGVHILCQTSPEAYETGDIITPSTPMHAQFGDYLLFLGSTLKATTPDGPGVYRAGGALPITLFWDVVAQPPMDYHVFLHLCQDCDTPPVASDDGPPLGGYLPTSTWLPGKPARDDRVIMLPHDMAPGKYQLLLGWYAPTDPSEDARLPVVGEPQLSHHRLLLGTIEVRAP